LPLRAVGEIELPGDGSRFDYASVDSARGLLFVAHLGASEVIEVDVHSKTVVRTIPNLSQVHGVLVVPGLHRVYATATGEDQMVTFDEDTGAVLNRAPTGEYPDGLAYDPKRNAVWTTNETGGSETVFDANSAAVRGTVAMGGEVGNVAYDPAIDRMLVAVQGRGDLAVIDPAALTVATRVALPGCSHPHGLALDPNVGTAFVACDRNATLLSVDIGSGQFTGSNLVGDGPDVLAYDQDARRLYVAAESGEVTALDERGGKLVVVGSEHLADGAHVVAVDPATHHSYFPIPSGAGGHPVLLERAPTT
jgi:DNA-binding beta-propeller fold protein YncE